MDIIKLIEEYNHLGISNIEGHERFNLYAITAHSTQIEGATLTTQDIQLLIEDGSRLKENLWNIP